MLAMNNQKLKFKNHNIYNYLLNIKIMKHLGVNLTKKCAEPVCTKNYKTMLREMKEVLSK